MIATQQTCATMVGHVWMEMGTTHAHVHKILEEISATLVNLEFCTLSKISLTPDHTFASGKSEFFLHQKQQQEKGRFHWAPKAEKWYYVMARNKHTVSFDLDSLCCVSDCGAVFCPPSGWTGGSPSKLFSFNADNNPDAELVGSATIVPGKVKG